MAEIFTRKLSYCYISGSNEPLRRYHGRRRLLRSGPAMYNTEMLSYKGMFRYLPREKFRFSTFLDPMLLPLGLREFLAYEKCKFYKQVPENKILPYFICLGQLLKVWTHEI